MGKIVKVATLLFVGLGVGSIIDLIKSQTGAGKKKCPLTPDVQKQLDLVEDALNTMSGINILIFKAQKVLASFCLLWLFEFSLNFNVDQFYTPSNRLYANIAAAN